MSHLPLPFLRAFEAVARLGYVRSAAAELHVTPGAVSHQLRALEQTLGVALFTRERNRLHLTKQGVALRQTASTIIADLKSCVATITALDQSSNPQKIAISTPTDFGIVWLTPAIFEFCEAYGLTSLKMTAAREMSQIDWRIVDAAIVYDNPPWPGYRWQSLGSLILRPVCSPRILNGPLPLKSPRDIGEHCLLHEDDGGEWQRWLNAAKIVGTPLRNAHFSSFTMALTAAVEGRGVALASDLLAQQYLRAGKLVRPFDIGVPASKSYYLVFVESRNDEFLIQRFAEWIMAQASQSEDKDARRP